MKHNTLRLNFELFQFSFEFFYFDFHPVYICYIVLKKSDILPICFVLYIDGSCFKTGKRRCSQGINDFVY